MKIIIENPSLTFERTSKDEFKVTLEKLPHDFPDKIKLMKGEVVTIDLPSCIIEVENPE